MLDVILPAVRQRLAELPAEYGGRINAEIRTDTAERLWVLLESARYFGEIEISAPDFRPYRYAAFQLLDKESDPQKAPAFVYYDREGDSADDVLAGLNRGFAKMISDGECQMQALLGDNKN